MNIIRKYLKSVCLFLMTAVLFLCAQTNNYVDKQGRKQGKHITYYENGKIKSIWHYHNDTLEGKSYHYYYNGKKELEITFRKGLQVDTYKHYAEQGYMDAMFVIGDTSQEWFLLDTGGEVLQKKYERYTIQEIEKRKLLLKK